VGEHEDDLESTVNEQADEEIEGFPDTGEELDEETGGDSSDEEEKPDLDEDPAEL
jgi:hypothetical protein